MQLKNIQFLTLRQFYISYFQNIIIIDLIIKFITAENTMKSALTSAVNPTISQNQPVLASKNYTFYLDIPYHQSPLKIDIELDPTLKVSEALFKVLQIFKVQLASHNEILETKIEFFCLRLPKKNGKPKLDMPCLDSNQKIADVKINTLSIQIKNQQAVRKQQSETMEVDKTVSMESINTQIGMKRKQKEIPEEGLQQKKEKQNQCFFSFC